MATFKTKERKITLLKEQILSSIDNLTFKLTEVSLQGIDVKSRSSVASDRDDQFDAAILNRMAEFRDARLRQRLQFCLKNEEITEFTNTPSTDNAFVYDLVLPEGFKDMALKMIGTQMHEYIVKGALLDWYIQAGVNTNTNDLAAQVNEIESTIVNMLRVPSGMKKPLQPFGPAV